eukprot:407598_1
MLSISNDQYIIRIVSEYLDYQTLIALDNSEINFCKLNLQSHAFNVYLNEWKHRQTLYAFDDNIIDNIGLADTTGWSKYSLMRVNNSEIIANIDNQKSITSDIDIPMKALSYILEHYEIEANYFDEINCHYDPKQHKWMYNIANIVYHPKNWPFDDLIPFNQFDKILNSLIGLKWTQTTEYRDRLSNLLGISVKSKSKSNLSIEYMISKWYLMQNQERSDWQTTKYTYSIFALLNHDIIPKDWQIQNVSVHRTDFFIFFHLVIFDSE